MSFPPREISRLLFRRELHRAMRLIHQSLPLSRTSLFGGIGMAKMNHPIIPPPRLPTIYKHPPQSLSSLPLTAPVPGMTESRRVIYHRSRPFIVILNHRPRQKRLATSNAPHSANSEGRR